MVNALYMSIVNSDVLFIKRYLHSRRFNLNDKNISYLIVAIIHKNYEIAKEILDYNANPNLVPYNDHHPLFYASIYNPNILKILINNGGDPNYISEYTGKTVLSELAENGNITNFINLLNCGADPFLENKDKTTTLDIAKKYKKYDIIKFLENL